MKKAKGDSEIRISYRPWPAFILFAIISAILSYSSLSIPSKLFIGFFGLLIPFCLALTLVHFQAPPKGALFEKEFLSGPPYWVWGAAVLGAFVLRFYALTRWPVWPNTDEGLIGRFALDLVQKWNGRFFYTFGQAPPGMVWLLTPFISLLQNPLKALWLLPACLSFLAALLTYGATRPYFSKSFSFLVFLLSSLSFWPVFSGRFCHQGVLLLLWAWLTLGTLGLFLKSNRPESRVRWAVTLGAATGLGSLTFTPWLSLALWVCAIVFYVSFFRKGGQAKVFAWFGAALFITLIPFFIGVLTEGFGQHIYGVSSARGYIPLGAQVTTVMSYLTASFWGVFEDQAAYAPVWGGMLNPLLTAAFFIGVIQTWVNRRRQGIQWAWAGGLLCLMPGLLSMNVEMYRVVLVLPFLLAGAVLGLQQLVTELRPQSRVLYLTFFVLASLSLDLGHLVRPYWSPLFSKSGPLLGVPPGKPIHSYLADEILQKQSAAGPGLIFGDFTAEPYDQTLTVGTYGFNALINPKCSNEEVKWAALMLNVNEKPFLEKRFPDAQWYYLDQDKGLPDGGLMLVIIPIGPDNQMTFENWVRVYPFFRELDWHWLNLADGVKGEPLLADFARVKALLAGDSFLEECYWEKVEGILYRDRNYPADVAALEKAITEGCPSAHLYYKLGSIQLRKNEIGKARQNLQKAQASALNLTLSKEALQMADEIEKQGGMPEH